MFLCPFEKFEFCRAAVHALFQFVEYQHKFVTDSGSPDMFRYSALLVVCIHRFVERLSALQYFRRLILSAFEDLFKELLNDRAFLLRHALSLWRG